MEQQYVKFVKLLHSDWLKNSFQSFFTERNELRVSTGKLLPEISRYFQAIKDKPWKYTLLKSELNFPYIWPRNAVIGTKIHASDKVISRPKSMGFSQRIYWNIEIQKTIEIKTLYKQTLEHATGLQKSRVFEATKQKAVVNITYCKQAVLCLRACFTCGRYVYSCGCKDNLINVNRQKKVTKS